MRTARCGQTARTSFCCIQGQSRRYKTFVVNRISEIHQKSNPRQWRHVPTELNCADDATRGLHPKELLTDHHWFSGPEFLYKKEEDWPQRKQIKQKNVVKTIFPR